MQPEDPAPSKPRAEIPVANLRDSWALLSAYRRNPLKGLQEMQRQWGSVGKADIGILQFYHCAEPGLVYDAMVRQHCAFQRAGGGRFGLSLFDHGGIVTSSGEDWKDQRLRLKHIFRPDSGAIFHDAMNEALDDHLPRWAKSGEIDLTRDVLRYTFAAMSKTIFGHDLGADADILVDHIDILRRRMVKRAMTVLPLPWQIAWLGDRQTQKSRTLVFEILDREITRHLDAPERKDTIIGALLERDKLTGAQGEIERQKLIDKIFQLTVALHATTGGAIGFALEEIARRPDVQQKILAEAQNWQSQSSTPDHQHIAALDYTTRAFQEAMRLNPPGYAVMREVTQDITLTDAETGQSLDLKKGSSFNVAIAALHRDPRFWDKPDAFDIGHFAPEAVAQRPRCAYMPFGFGPHQCIGRGLAMQEGVLLLSRLLAEYELVPVTPKTEADVRLTMGPGAGAKIKLRKRQPTATPEGLK